MKELVLTSLIDRGFSPGLIGGAAHLSAARWRDVGRCKSRGDALALAEDIARDLTRVRDYKAIRRHEFRCEPCNNDFDVYFTYNTYDQTALDSARQGLYPCPKCGSPSGQQWRTAPGIAWAKWSVNLGGKTYSAEEFDEIADANAKKEKQKAFFHQPEFGDQFMSRLEETAVKTMAGEIPPPKAIDPAIADDVAKQILGGV